VRARDPFLRNERTRCGVSLFDIRLCQRCLGEAQSQQDGQGNRVLHASHPIELVKECAAY
jgi:hypothetical protein